jgi:hypothetical protein
LRILLGLSALAPLPTLAQFGEQQQNIPQEVPPPTPPPKPPEQAVEVEPVAPETPAPPLPAEILQHLQQKARTYQAYARKFTCDETARLADYKESGDSSEQTRRYAYTLLNDPVRQTVLEYRQELARDGSLKGVAEDGDPFPPAYAWVFLFTEFHEPYFTFSYLGERFDGFDLVLEVHFKGSLPFTDGRDIRQWEGRALIDAIQFTLLEVQARPVAQEQRLAAIFDNWAQSFNFMGFRTGRKPLGYQAEIEFRYRRDELNFPTTIRYETHKAVSRRQVVPMRASTRTYQNYRFFETATDPEDFSTD